ncbi:MAG TPA: serine hydrolase domain-containing protein [Pseudonocardiaceae bacterium]|nr:serine hydrolase domain-containing protein [Pseudonocardiaceae bacterium]
MRSPHDVLVRMSCSAADLGARLAELANRHHVPGAQFAWYDGDDTIVVHTGVERHGRPVAMDASSKVPIGSITKACTATVAMMLVADGDLELDEPVSAVLGPVAHGDTLTLRHLLCHTSGLPSDPAADATTCSRELAKVAPVCAPGAMFSYSNFGYAVVGAMIEAATGMSWREAVDAVLCQPVGIEPAFVDEPLDVAGHVVSASSVRVVDQVLPPLLAPAGALALSAADLVTFGRLHLAEPEPLDATTQMYTRVAGVQPFGIADGWTLGLSMFDSDKGVEWLGHDGAADGTSCHLRIDQAGGGVLALTTNATTGMDLWRSLVEELRSLGVPLARPRARLCRGDPVPLPPEYTGTYRNGDTEYVVAPDIHGVPCVTVDGEVFPELLVDSDGVFSVREPVSGQQADCGRFLLDPYGAVTALEAGGRVARRH